MADAAADTLGLVVGPYLLGLLVFAFTYPIGRIIVDAQGSLGIQSWWTWVLGASLWIAIYAITGQNIM